MKYLIAILAVGALTLVTATESHAQKGYGGGHGWGNGYGQSTYGHCHRQGHRHGYAGAYGHGGHWGHWNHHRYHGGYHHLRNVPVLPPPAYNAGPPTAAVTYPYYTTRGPRDFLIDNPPSIGP